jgi:hypothetical protein
MTFEIVMAVLGLCGVIITTYLVPWIKANRTAAQLEVYKTWARAAITFAQTMNGGTLIGTEKFEWVIDQLQLAGVKMTDEQMRGLVQDLYNQIKENLQPATPAIPTK